MYTLAMYPCARFLSQHVWPGGHDSVVLGALGCGVFANPPEAIGRATDVEKSGLVETGHSQRMAQAATARWDFLEPSAISLSTESKRVRCWVLWCIQGGGLCRYLQQEKLCRVRSHSAVALSVFPCFFRVKFCRHSSVTLGHAVGMVLEVQITKTIWHSIWNLRRHIFCFTRGQWSQKVFCTLPPAAWPATMSIWKRTCHFRTLHTISEFGSNGSYTQTQTFPWQQFELGSVKRTATLEPLPRSGAPCHARERESLADRQSGHWTMGLVDVESSHAFERQETTSWDVIVLTFFVCSTTNLPKAIAMFCRTTPRKMDKIYRERWCERISQTKCWDATGLMKNATGMWVVSNPPFYSGAKKNSWFVCFWLVRKWENRKDRKRFLWSLNPQHPSTWRLGESPLMLPRLATFFTNPLGVSQIGRSFVPFFKNPPVFELQPSFFFASKPLGFIVSSKKWP